MIPRASFAPSSLTHYSVRFSKNWMSFCTLVSKPRPDLSRNISSGGMSCKTIKLGLGPASLPMHQDHLSHLPSFGFFPHFHRQISICPIDLIGPLSLADGFHYLLSTIDQMTHWAEATPLTNITTEIVTKSFLHSWVSRFGCPLVISAD